MRGSIWATLGIDPTNDVNEIRRAYARRLKIVHPEDDPEGFQDLRAAFDQATDMARNGWAVPRAYSDDVDDDEDDDFDGVWPDIEASRRWTRPEVPPSPIEEPAPRPSRSTQDWTIGAPGPAGEEAADIRAELDRERELVQSHRALCDRLTHLLSHPDGDRHSALSAMLAIFRSPAMDSLQTHIQTEHWLAWTIGGAGPVADDLVEPLIQFFGWDNRRIGVDLSHASMVLQRRETAAVLRHLQQSDSPDHAAWRALSKPATLRGRLRERFTLGLEAKVSALLDRLDYDLAGLLPQTDPKAMERWRRRQRAPIFPAIFLWALLTLPLLFTGLGMSAELFGPPDLIDALALWVLAVSVLTALGAVWLYGLVRPRRRWRDDGRVWTRPAWIRLGWAPVAVLVLLVSSVVPGDLPWVAAWWLILGPLVAWTSITNAHFEESRNGLRAGFFMAMIPLGWLVVHAHGAPWVSLCWVATGVTLVAHHGRPALEDAWLNLSHGRRQVTATMLAIGTVAATVAVATVPVPDNDWSLRTVTAAALILMILAARPIRLVQSLAAQTLWFNWMRFGWLPCAVAVWFAPYTVMASATFVAAGAWLAGGALLTLVAEAAPRLDQLLSRPSRKNGRR